MAESPTLASMAETQLSASMVQCQPSTDTFSKSSNSQLISSGHNVIHTPASFPVWGLLWLWWLSYPLRASVKLYPLTCAPELSAEKFKALPNWMIKYNQRKMINIKKSFLNYITISHRKRCFTFYYNLYSLKHIFPSKKNLLVLH